MRGVLDIDLYNRTGEVEYIEPLTEFVSPIDPMAAPAHNPTVRRKGKFTMNHNKPESAVLEVDLRAGKTIADIAKKYQASVATVNNWIRAYRLQGIKGQRNPKVVIQGSPTPAEIEQFHTDGPAQELPKVEMDQRYEFPILTNEYAQKLRDENKANESTDQNPAPRETFDEIWQDVRDDLKTLERLYIAEAKVLRQR